MPARYTLTARREGAWRWAEIECPKKFSRKKVVERAEEVVAEKLAEAQAHLKVEPSKKTATSVDVWERGGITLADEEGSIVWTRPVKQ